MDPNSDDPSVLLARVSAATPPSASQVGTAGQAVLLARGAVRLLGRALMAGWNLVRSRQGGARGT